MTTYVVASKAGQPYLSEVSILHHDYRHSYNHIIESILISINIFSAKS